MTIEMFILTLLISGSMLTNTHMCQCQCCRYMGPLYPNNRRSCACSVTNQGKPFGCGGSTGLYSARICTIKIHPFYDPLRPNLCCQLKFV
ncbi:unnamed protein product [Rotaria sordida]|uniref:Secreted protein n=1 Tax=Rotaria sordida TaxID=392033 RepID=A0A813U1C9_9BILA|nr:unnamed protein product [Rotaria sordida]CAF0939992.1 unnamed protein product [Rotaria sordida]CAF0975408.1 unnamed protein product [Rotaria sordida]CAF0976096.1 unnamed protein product [Rotaria sordida]CAF3607921.1 unnamed protein product [Rotaria sordida]